MFGVGTVEPELCFERNAVGKPALQALVDAVAGRVYEVIDELQHKVVARISNGKIFLKDFEKTFVFSVFGGGFKLKKILKRFQLYLQKIGMFKFILYGGEADAIGSISL
jgi:hypothetical protein